MKHTKVTKVVEMIFPEEPPSAVFFANRYRIEMSGPVAITHFAFVSEDGSSCPIVSVAAGINSLGDYREALLGFYKDAGGKGLTSSEKWPLMRELPRPLVFDSIKFARSEPHSEMSFYAYHLHKALEDARSSKEELPKTAVSHIATVRCTTDLQLAWIFEIYEKTDAYFQSAAH